MTVTEMAKAVGVSRPTVEEIAETLLSQGWLDEISAGPTAGRGAGRPARRFRFRRTAGYVLGIDVAPDEVHLLVADLGGNVIAAERTPTAVEAGRAERVAALRDGVARVLSAASIAGDRVHAAAVATTGIVDASGRVALANLPGWTGLDIAAELADLVPAPVTVENDMRAGAVAERWIGAASASDDVVYLHAGLRIGTGFIIDGRIPRGRHGAAGELAKGSGNRLLKAYDKLLDRQTAGSGPEVREAGGAPRDAHPVFERAARGEPAARRAVQAYALELVKAVEGLIVAIDPEVVVVGGSLSLAGAAVAEPIRQHLATACMFGPRVEVSPLGDDSVALGAVRIALNEVEWQLFGDGQGR